MNNPQSKPISMLHTAPSVTTFEYLNPAYRIYIVDQNNWELLDHEVPKTGRELTIKAKSISSIFRIISLIYPRLRKMPMINPNGNFFILRNWNTG
jgi:hypothetical protein